MTIYVKVQVIPITTYVPIYLLGPVYLFLYSIGISILSVYNTNTQELRAVSYIYY